MLLVVESSPCSPNRLLEDHRNAQHLCRPLPNYTILVEFKLEIVIFPTRNSQFIWHVEFLLTGYTFIFFLKWSRLLPLLSVGHLWQHWYPQDDPDIQREFPSTSVIKLFLKMSSTCFFVNSIGKKNLWVLCHRRQFNHRRLCCARLQEMSVNWSIYVLSDSLCLN